ncbi:MAG: rRNA maturation RNase YbeY [bacterium]
MALRLYYRKPAPLRIAALRRCLEALQRRFQLTSADIELSLVGEGRIRTLNRKYRRKDRVTDVLSFPLEPARPPRGRPWHLGEIVVALPVARRQARRAGRSLAQQVLRLAVHGLLHLQGHDHETGETQRRRFEALEARYLNYLAKKGMMPWDGSLRL